MKGAGAAMGIVLGLAAACGVLAVHARCTKSVTVRPPPLTAQGSIVGDDRGPLQEVLMHYVPELEGLFADAYRDFLGTLPSETHLIMVMRNGTRERFESFARRIDPSGALLARTRVLEIDVPLGLWSKDRALVLSPSAENAAAKTKLLVPPRPRPGESSRAADWDIVPAVAAQLPKFEMKQLPLAFDAGDFAVSGPRIVFDANLFARNRSRGYRSAEELRSRLTSLVSRDAVMLGREPGDVPRHHMSMYMALLGNGMALVGDPQAGARIVGRDYVPGEGSAETGAPLRADFSDETTSRFERAATDLTAAGFRVTRIPTVAFDDKTYFAYTNGIYETRAGTNVAWVPQFGERALDDAARAVYEQLGFRVIPVFVRALYTQHGTIGCLVNVLARGPA